MKFLLDTNIYFAVLHERSFFDAHRETFARIAPVTWVSSIVRFELLQGARGDIGRAGVTRATRHLEKAGRVVAPTHADWVRAGTAQGRLWDERPTLRTKILENDLLIACCARRIGAIVVTDNTEDFEIIQPYVSHRFASMAGLVELVGQ